MTVDDRLMNELSYREKVGESVYQFLFSVYQDLVENHVDRQIPYLHDVIEFTYADMYLDVRDNLISESVQRKDYELYEMTQEKYLFECYSGKLDDVAIEPYIDAITFRSKIIEAITENRLFLEDEGHFENQPILEVW